MMNTTKIEMEMKACQTVEELKKALKKAFVLLHPDNNLAEQEEATIAFLYVKDVFEAMRRKLEGYVPSRKIEEEVKKRNATMKIVRKIVSVEEFFSMSGEEQTAVLKACSARVAIVLDGQTPLPNAKQITDKHKADKNGNFDGVRSYAFVQYVFKKDRSIDMERLEEVAQEAWIKLAENATKEKYEGIPFYNLLWTSCRQAINNLYNAEIKHAVWMDRTNDLYDLNAYETKAPTGTATESDGVFNVWISSFFKDEIDRTIYTMNRDGYTETEISEYIGINQGNVAKRLAKIHDRMQKDRLLEGLNVTESDLGLRKNATAKETVRILIMKAIQNGMSFKRIAWYLHCEQADIPKMLRK